MKAASMNRLSILPRLLLAGALRLMRDSRLLQKRQKSEDLSMWKREEA
jgi:hypothetical protein